MRIFCSSFAWAKAAGSSWIHAMPPPGGASSALAGTSRSSANKAAQPRAVRDIQHLRCRDRVPRSAPEGLAAPPPSRPAARSDRSARAGRPRSRRPASTEISSGLDPGREDQRAALERELAPRLHPARPARCARPSASIVTQRPGSSDTGSWRVRSPRRDRQALGSRRVRAARGTARIDATPAGDPSRAARCGGSRGAGRRSGTSRGRPGAGSSRSATPRSRA